MSKFLKHYNKFIKCKGLKHDKNLIKFRRLSKKDTNSINCYECGKKGHMKSDCPTFSKKKGKAPSKSNTKRKRRRAFIAWEDEDETSFYNFFDNVVSDLCHMAQTSKECELSDYDSCFFDNKPSYDQLHCAFVELHEEEKNVY